MKCKDIIKYLEDWAPKGIAWDKDNVGLQVGSIKKNITNIILCLEVTEEVVREAINKNCNLIISHHPLLFSPIKKVDLDKQEGKILELLIKKNITVYSAHTNLDFTKEGVSFQLAKKLRLKKINFLQHLSSNQTKIIVFVPKEYVETVAEAMHANGAGIIGEYSNCSFRTIGLGTFKGSEKSSPMIGKKLKLESVDEVKLEMIVNKFDLPKVLTAMKSAHPYEEIAYDIYPLLNENVNYGMGAIGELEKEINAKDFLRHISKSINVKGFRYTEGKINSKIKKVAVCGGSGSDLLEVAINKGADAFITADVKYHTFHDANKRILLVDAGHYETERIVLDELKNRISNLLESSNKVYKFSGSTNPVVFYNN